MKRSGFIRKADSPFSSFANAKTALRRTEMKKRARKKPTVADGSKYLEACRGEECYLQIVGVCNGDWTTCVPAHRNEGKGMGLKVSSELTAPACYACHAEYDQGKRFVREEKREIWNQGYSKWQPVRARKMQIETMEFEA